MKKLDIFHLIYNEIIKYLDYADYLNFNSLLNKNEIIIHSRKCIFCNKIPYFPTSMDFLPHSQILLVRSYLFGYIWTQNEEQTWEEILDRKPCRMMLPIRKSNVQGETIFFDDDGRFVYLISENSLEPHPVYRMELIQK